MNARHFWAGSVGFFVGVAGAELVPLGLSLALLLALLASAVVALRDKRASLCAVMLFAAALGVLRVDIADKGAVSILDQHMGERVTLVGRVADEPDRRETSVRLTIAPASVVLMDGRSLDVSDAPHVLVPVRLPVAFSYGDTVEVRGIIRYPESFGDDGRIFDYPAFLSARDIYYEIPFAEAEALERGGWSFRGTLFSVKQAYLDGLERTLPEPHASLAGGITVGDKRSLGERLTRMFQQTGLVHIVVLSGYNITLVVGLLMIAVQHLPLRWRFILGGGAVLTFVLMTGASATGVRAGAMAVIALLAAAAYRKYAIDRALTITAAGMVLWNPHTLLYDPGFQLSVIATIGLIHVAPLFEERLKWITERLQLRSIAGATLGTQMAVLPLLLYQTGVLSVISLPANLLVLPAIPAAMVASALAGTAGVVHDTLGMIVGIPAYLLLEYVVEMTEFLGNIPMGAFKIPAFAGWWVVAAYVALFFIWQRLRSAVPRSSS